MLCLCFQLLMDPPDPRRSSVKGGAVPKLGHHPQFLFSTGIDRRTPPRLWPRFPVARLSQKPD